MVRNVVGGCVAWAQSIIQLTQNIDLFVQAKSEEQVATEKQWLDTEKVWLMHRGGFAAARKDTTTPPDIGKLTIRLEQTGEVLNVDEDDVEKVCFGWIVFVG